MGFIAENIREGMLRKAERLTELAKSLYQKKVYADSVNMHNKIASPHGERNRQMNYFRRYVRDSSLARLSDKFYPSFFWTFAITSCHPVLTPNDGILDQLRSSGTLRYFKGIPLQKSIGQHQRGYFECAQQE